MTSTSTKQMKWVIGAFAASFFTMNANAAIIFSDNFTGGLANWSGGINVSGQVTPDVVLNNTTFCGGISGNSCLDMDGSGTNSNADISTSTALTLVAGSYTFSFNWGNNAGTGVATTDNNLNWTIIAGLNTLASGSVNSGQVQDFTYALNSTPFTVASTVSGAVIRMWQTGNENNDGGTILDDVQLTLDATAVPEPGAVALLGLGLAGLGFSRRKKQIAA